ncbi:hypothetical protein JCM6882_001382 [Rhodosporidiobolus microsporus]
MPRPRQRKGAAARKEEKQAKREQQEAEDAARLAREKRERERKTRMDMDALPTASGSRGPAANDPDALPEPDPDTKAYFQKVAEQIEEMTAQGAGQRETQIVVNDLGEEVEEEVEDERPLLLRSALESLSGHEISLAGDGESSVVLEQLLYAMDDFAKRVLLDRFAGQFERLVRHRSASHVLQTLFELAGETVDRETRGDISTGPSTDESSTLPLMTDLLLSLLTELLPTLPQLIYDPFASHCIRILLLVFSGVPCSSASSSNSSGPSKGSSYAARSKKSTQFRKNQGASFGKNWLADDASLTTAQQSGGKGKARAAEERLPVPSSFIEAVRQMHDALNALDTEAAQLTGAQNAVPGEGTRKAAMHEVAGPVLRILIELEAAQPDGGWTAGGWADRILCGLVSEVQAPETVPEAQSAAAGDLREEYLAGLLRHPASSPTFEMILHLAPPAVFSPLWSSFFVGKVHRLAANAVANFVVAVGISRVNEEEMRALVDELAKVAEERRGEWIDNFRTGVLRALMESAARLECCEGEVSELLLDTFGLKSPEEKKLVVPCVLTLNRLQHWKKLASGVAPEPSTQGSVLLQTWLRMHAPHNQPVLDSITSLPFDQLLPFTRSATSSRVLDALLSSPTVPPRSLRTFLLSLIGHIPELADDRIGSRIAERAFATADPFLKDKMAASCFDRQDELQRSAYGHFLARKMELPLWGRRREEWKLKMGRLMAEEKAKALAATSPAPAVEAKKDDAAEQHRGKKRERKTDDIDAIFESKGAVLAAPATEAATTIGGEEDERAAKRARKEAKRAKKAAAAAAAENGGAGQEDVEDVLAAIKASV